jgi:DNA-binding response OmpR family regulator
MQAVSDHPAPHAAQRTLLIIDDQQSVRVSLTYFLESAGYRVLSADSGKAALALADAEPFDGALIDIHMPGMNGFDTFLALQSKLSTQGRAARLWLMTGVCTSDVERRGKELGALGVFRKPFEFSSFQQQLVSGLSVPQPAPAPLPTLSCAVVGDELTS